MRLQYLALPLSLGLLSACGPASGYYDQTGNWHPSYPDTTVREGRAYTPDAYPGYSPSFGSGYAPSYYHQAGYYDYRGAYMGGSGWYSALPNGYFPPPGMCRVWFTDRAPNYEPPVESCNGIQGRVPAGAYVIYGG